MVVIAVLAIVLPGHSSGSSETTPVFASTTASENVNPVDVVSSSSIAATAAQMANLPETTAIVNQADSDMASVHMVATSDSLAPKPQVVTSQYVSNKDIKTYVVKKGETLASVAKKFNLSQDTIKWSNHLVSITLSKGQKLLIPPIDGIVYKVKKGDTADSLAKKYNASKAKIIAYNDAEIKGLKVGETIIIPGGTKSVPKPVASYGYGSSSGSSASGGYAWGQTAVYGHNGYDYGYCTWYVANQINMPANWGNASSWSYYAAQTPGWSVSSAPTPGSIAQRTWGAGGAGHVAIVHAVKGDQILITDMNGIAGWGSVGKGWKPISRFNHFITKK